MRYMYHHDCPYLATTPTYALFTYVPVPETPSVSEDPRPQFTATINNMCDWGFSGGFLTICGPGPHTVPKGTRGGGGGAVIW